MIWFTAIEDRNVLQWFFACPHYMFDLERPKFKIKDAKTQKPFLAVIPSQTVRFTLRKDQCSSSRSRYACCTAEFLVMPRPRKGLGRRNFAQAYPRSHATPTPTSTSKGQKSRSWGGAGAYCGGHLAAQLVDSEVVLLTCGHFDISILLSPHGNRRILNLLIVILSLCFGRISPKLLNGFSWNFPQRLSSVCVTASRIMMAVASGEPKMWFSVVNGHYLSSHSS